MAHPYPAPLARIDVDELARRDPDLLLDAFEHDHHPRLRERLPALVAQVEQLVSEYGGDWPGLAELPAQLERLGTAVVWHMRKEEQLLYPYIRALTDACRTGATLPQGPFGSVRNPIRVMEGEHLEVDAGLRDVRATMARLAETHQSCAACRAVLEALNGFIEYLESHMRLEHEVVYPKAEEMERRLPV